MVAILPLVVAGAKYLAPAALAGIGGYAFSLGMGSGALQTAPEVYYQQSLAMARGYGEGIQSGMWDEAYTQRAIDRSWLDYDRRVYLEKELFNYLVESKIQSLRDITASPKYGYRLLI